MYLPVIRVTLVFLKSTKALSTRPAFLSFVKALIAAQTSGPSHFGLAANPNPAIEKLTSTHDARHMGALGV
jgi:hypothetical protein